MAHEREARQAARDDPGPSQLPIDFLRTYASSGRATEPLCPLHLAMQELARAAVSQLVYYAEGEYAPRPDLLRELERWQRAHCVIADGVCPASRTAGDPAVALRVACTLIPEDRFATARELLRCCAQRKASDPCPLAGESEVRLFTPQ
jgi:hypothetical protein